MSTISREAAIEAVGDVHPLDYNGQAILDRIKALPTIDPVKHGKWIKRAKTNPDAELCSDYDWECSECGKMDTHNEKVEVKYCWNCGSRMDGEQR